MAKVGGTLFTSFADAVTEAKKGTNTITLISDLTISSSIYLDEEVDYEVSTVITHIVGLKDANANKSEDKYYTITVGTNRKLRSHGDSTATVTIDTNIVVIEGALFINGAGNKNYCDSYIFNGNVTTSNTYPSYCRFNSKLKGTGSTNAKYCGEVELRALLVVHMKNLVLSL